jgi:hypothetical protein
MTPSGIWAVFADVLGYVLSSHEEKLISCSRNATLPVRPILVRFIKCPLTTLSSGENASERDLNGCLEEYDEPR